MSAKKPTLTQIGDALGMGKSGVCKLAAKGMPTSSVAAAVEWHAKRKGLPPKKGEATPGEMPAVEPVAPEIALGMIGELEKRIRKARKLAESAQDRAQSEIEGGDGEAAKKAGDLASSSQKTLLMLERELRQRRIDAGDLVPKVAALESYGRLVGELLAAIDAGESAFCSDANPDNPGRAAKAFRRFRDAVRLKVAGTKP